MPFQPAPNVAQAEIRATLLGEPVENVLNFLWEGVGAIDGSAVEALANALLAAWVAEIMPQVGGNYTLREVVVTDLTSEGSYTYTAVQSPPLDGSQTGEALPASCALVITHRTGLAGRSNRGRTYMCGFVEAQSSGNFMLPTPAAAVLSGFQDVISAAGAVDWQFGVLSRWDNKVLRPFAIISPVTSMSLRSTRWDRQGRRMPKE